MRINSEAVWVTGEDIDWTRKEIIVRGDPVTAIKNSETRRVPILPDMENLLARMRERLGSFGKGPVLQVGRCNEALARACQEIGISKLTHHDLRHLFATRCIESGVDIPTVSRWLGHKDGGPPAQRTFPGDGAKGEILTDATINLRRRHAPNAWCRLPAIALIQ